MTEKEYVGVFLAPSDHHPEAIRRIANAASLKLRGDQPIDPLTLLTESKAIFSMGGVGRIEWSTDEWLLKLRSRHNLKRMLYASKDGDEINFKISFEGPCGVAPMNRAMANFFANCFLHVRPPKDQDEFIVNCDDISENIRRQAKIFLRSFLYADNILEKYIDGGSVSKTDLAKLLGVETSEMVSYWFSKHRPLPQNLPEPAL